MPTRHLIGRSADAPTLIVRWCRGRWPDALPPGLVFCVPTSLALRRLRDALIDAYGAFQGVRFLTPAALPTLFAPPAETPAATPAEMLRVWARVFEWLRGADPSDAVLASLFPGRREWLARPAARYALARRLMALRDTLAERCLDFGAVAAHPETALLGARERNRWAALDLLETKSRETLAALGLEDPADRQLAALRDPVPQPLEAADDWRLVVACVPDLMPALTRLFDAAPACDVLVLAEPAEAERFTPHGLPDPDAWARLEIPLPDAAIRPAENPQGEADAVEAFLDAHRRVDPADLCLCALDREAMPPLTAALADHGVTIFEPEPIALAGQPPARALMALAGLLRDPTPRALLPLLTLPEAASAVGATVARLRADYDALMAERCPDTRRDALRFAGDGPLRDFLLRCQAWADAFLDDPVPAARAFLSDLYGARTVDPVRDPLRFAAFDALRGLLNELAGLRTGDAPDPDLLAARLADETLRPVRGDADCAYEGRLEVLWSRAPLLALIGLNEGLFPDTTFEDAFLPNAFRRALGLRNDATRAARDAYLLTAATAWRDPADLLLTCARTNLRGDWLKPTRLLFRCPPEARAARARALFLDPAPRPAAPPPGTALAFAENPARWRDDVPLPTRLSASAIARFLASPLAYWLSDRLRLDDAEDLPDGMGPMAFGILIHSALEALRTTAATEPGALADTLTAAYDAAFRERYGAHPGIELLAARASAHRRLLSAARLESQSRLDGWETVYSERDTRGPDWELPLEVDGHALTLYGQIDRVDRNRHTGAWRVVDYKTGKKGEPPDKTHYAKSRDGEVHWMTFQLPLYRLLLRRALRLPPSEPVELAYFLLPAMGSATLAPYHDPESERATEDALRATLSDLLALGRDPIPADVGEHGDPLIQLLTEPTAPCD